MTSQATPTLEEDDTGGWIVYRRQSDDTGMVENLSNKERSTLTTDKYKLRAIRDFDPQKMDERERLEMEIFMGRNEVARNIPQVKNKYYQQRLPLEVALTFTRGDILETIPPENIGGKSGWFIVLHAKSGKIGPIQKKHVVIDNDGEPSASKLHEIPMELLDKVLESSFLHWLLNSTNISKKIFTVLASVDFCWFQLMAKQRFKNRILMQMKDIFGRTKRRSAIIRNNQNYLKEYIKPNKDLLDKLLSLNCITENQVRIIQRLRYQSSEILHLIKSRDETKYYNFVKCFRQTNKTTVARILENGGAVVKVEVNNRGAECSTFLDTDTLHRNIEQLRNGARSWSLQVHELCSQRKREGLEILNSERNLENVVIWIWCRSQAALENLQILFESNQLAHVFFSFTNVQPTPSEVSKSQVINIDSHEFTKKIGKLQ